MENQHYPQKSPLLINLKTKTRCRSLTYSLNLYKKIKMKAYLSFLGSLLVISFFFNYSHTIFPIMDYDEYFVDENAVIHNKSCQYRSVPWFTTKPSKYDFIKMKGQEFCDECFSRLEISKMNMLHEYNVQERINHLKGNGAPEEYIDKELEHYADE